MANYDDTATVSGSVVSIENGADDVGAKSCVVTVSPTLSGVSSVTEKRTGRNISSVSEYSNNPWAFWGTNFVDMVNVLNTLPTGNYTLSYTFEVVEAPDTNNISYGKPYIRAYINGTYYNLTSYTIMNASSVSVGSKFTVSASFTIDADKAGKISYCYIYCDKKESHSGTGRGSYNLVNAMIELGSTAHAYETYSPTQYTASLGRTIYGGQADIVNGTGQETHAKMTFTGAAAENWSFSTSGGNSRVFAQLTNAKTDTNTFASNLITPAPSASGYPAIGTGWINNNGRIVIGVDSSITSVADWQDYLSSNNMEIAYELADAYKTDFTFTGQEVPTRLGYNTFWSEQGDTEVTYYKSDYGYTSVTVNKLQSKNFFPFDKNQSFLQYKTFRFRIPKGSYTISWDLISTTEETLPAYMQVSYVYEDGTTVYNPVTAALGKMSRSFTLAKNVTIITIYSSTSYASSAGITATIDNIQLELGSQATSYEPYVAPVSKTAKLHKILYGGLVDAIKGTAKPKNLVDDRNMSSGLPSTTIGASIDTITSSTRYCYFGFASPKRNVTIRCETTDTSKINAILFFGYKNNVLSEYRNVAVINQTRTVDCSEYDYVRIGAGSSNSQIAVPLDFSEYGFLQAEAGSSFRPMLHTLNPSPSHLSAWKLTRARTPSSPTRAVRLSPTERTRNDGILTWTCYRCVYRCGCHGLLLC